MKFAVPANHRVKVKEGEKKDKYIDLAGELKKNLNKTMEHEGDSNNNSVLVRFEQPPEAW